MPGSWGVCLQAAISSAAIALSFGCSRNPRPDGPEPPPAADGTVASPAQPADVSAEGIIYVAGSDPGVILTLRPDSGAALELRGDLAGELRRLSGARVEVRGAPTHGGPWAGITVETYRVLAVEGRRPLVGVLTRTDGSLWLVGEDSVTVADSDGRLARLVGAKVWVLPDSSSPKVVQSYGVIREADR
jgi:hypothetical protein